MIASPWKAGSSGWIAMASSSRFAKAPSSETRTPVRTSTRVLSWGATLAATDEVTVWANAAFYRNTFGDFVIEQAGGVTDLTGNRLNMSPEYLVNWGVLYSPTPVVDVTLDVKHVSDVFVDIRNDFVFDPYTLVGAAVSWQVGLARLTVSGTNLFDEEYYWGGSTSFAETADPGRPRQILVTTSFTFGP